MTHDRFAGTVTAWLRDDAESAVPDHLTAVLEQTRRVRQRPWWSSLGRWLPMDVPLRVRFAPAPRGAWLLVILALLLAIAVAAALIGARPKGLAPFGPAGNGTVLFGANSGDIYAFDPVTGSSTPLITGASIDRSPMFSRDGSVFVFARSGSTTLPGHAQLMLAKADGTIVRPLANAFLPSPIDWSDSLDWSPDGSRIALVDASTRSFSIVPVDGNPAQVIQVGMRPENVQWRPNGLELVFRGVATGPAEETAGLYVIRADGTGLRQITPVNSTGAEFQEPALSPDGARVMYTMWDDAGGHLEAVDVDSGATQRLRFEPRNWSDYFAVWSPDGSRIVLNRGRAQESYHLAVAPAAGGAVVDIGPSLDWDAAANATFSPDGSKVIVRYGSGSTWIFDATGGPGQQLQATRGDPLSWQRVAP